MIKSLTNPFEIYNEKKLLTIGIFFLIIAALISSQFDLLLYGSLKILNNYKQLYFAAIFNICITVFSNVAVFFLFGRIRYSKTRFIDVLNVMLVAHIPMYFVLFLTGLPIIEDAQTFIELEILGSDNLQSIVLPKEYALILGLYAILALSLLVYFFYLIIVGMKIAINSKSNWDNILMILMVLLWNTLLQIFNLFI